MNLNETLKENNLYVTDYEKPTIVDAVRAVYNVCGQNFFESNMTKKIRETLNTPKHILFILSDGMGSNLINSLDDNSILKKNKVMDLQTVNPSTTGCAIPSILTGEYPAKHGMLGWFSYNKEKNIEYLPVLFCERNTGKSLTELNITFEEIYKTPSALNNLNRKSFALFPEYMVNSPFSSFAVKNRIGYTNISNAFEIYIDEILNLDFETYTYMYLPDVDSNEHRFGVSSKEVSSVMSIIEKEVRDLYQKVFDENKELEIIITADHGQINVSGKPITMDFEKYKNFFYALPGIDAGTATYYVKKEFQNDFEQAFQNDYEGKMFLFKTDELIKNNIFGPEPLSAYMENNIGEYVSFCKKGLYFVNSVEEDEELNSLKGTHSGFARDEIIVPFIVIK